MYITKLSRILSSHTLCTSLEDDNILIKKLETFLKARSLLTH